MRGVPHNRDRGSSDFGAVVDCFLAGPGLPFASILSAERIERIFTEHGNLFGVGQIYSTAVVLWAFSKLIDGFTFTMPGTTENQAEYPQQKGQKPGVGLPIARAVAIISLATACAMDLEIGPDQ